MSRWSTSLGLLAGGALAFACRQIVGIGDDGSQAAGTNACGFDYGTSACAACASASCCAESNACAKDSSCNAFQGCLAACKGDPACWSMCATEHPATGTAVSAISACMAVSCETACGLTCGGFAGHPFPPTTATACARCLTAKASSCEATRACATSDKCDTAVRCRAASPTVDLSEACETTAGVDPSWEWNPDAGTGGAVVPFETAAAACGSVCTGADWHCVGDFGWPPSTAASAPYTIDLWLKDFSSPNPVSGATVDVCDLTDVKCDTSYASGNTDPNGALSLHFQNVRSAGGPNGLFGYLRITGADLVPTYQYWGFPLSASAYFTGAEVVTTSEIAGVYAALQVTPDPTRGVVAVKEYDCSESPAPGLTVKVSTADSATRSFSASAAPTEVTDGTGFIFFTNVPAGDATVTATAPGVARPTSVVSMTVRAQGETSVLAFPTP